MAADAAARTVANMLNVRFFVTAFVFALLLVLRLGAAGGTSGSGLHGRVLIYPGYPACQAGTPCTRPAKHALLEFWRNGRPVGRTRTDARGRYRIGLRPRTYQVASASRGTLTPRRVKVPFGRFKSVTFKLDIGIR